MTSDSVQPPPGVGQRLMLFHRKHADKDTRQAHAELGGECGSGLLASYFGGWVNTKIPEGLPNCGSPEPPEPKLT